MRRRKATNLIAKQRGFLTIGVGLTLLAVYGAVGTGILATHETDSDAGEVLVSQEQPVLSSNADGSLDSRYVK